MTTLQNILAELPWIASTLLAALLLLALLILFNRRRLVLRGNTLLLVGAPNAGKTAILTTLVYNQTLSTVTSLQTNSSVVTLPDSKKTIRVVDIPGHPRIRDQFREHLTEAKAIVFVVDSSTVSRNGAVVAEHLHVILHALTSLPPSQSPPALLIAAHKADVLKSSTTSSAVPSDSQVVTRVKTVLERELGKRKESQSGGVGVEGLGAEGERSDMGGLDCRGVAFKFSEWDGGDVNFIVSSVSVGERFATDAAEKSKTNGLDALREWLQEFF